MQQVLPDASKAGPAVVEAWSLSSRIHGIPGHTLWGSVRGWGVSAQISVESCYTDESLVLGYLMRSVFSLSWLTWGETSQVIDSTQLLGAQGTGFVHFIIAELKVLLVFSSWWGNSKSLLAKVIPREWILKDLTAQMGSEFVFSVLNTSFS